MHVVHTFEELAGVAHNVYLAIGVFDGVHLGHQAVVLTFDPHPQRVVHPEKAPPLLTTTPHKLRLLEPLGVHACLLVTFDHPFSLTPPEQFIEQVAHRTNSLREICVGARFRFGHRHAGDVRLIAALAPTHGFLAREIAPVTLGNDPISSTAVRQLILHGDLDRAAAMLGRPYSILGVVQHGDQIGQRLGYPTANLDPQGELLPPDGVYVARAFIDGQSHGGLVNIGRRPTFEGRSRQRRCELHVLDFHRDLYGQEIEVQFLQKLRDEQRFDSPDALRRQIAADEQAARALL